MCGLQIWLCLFMFWPIALKQLNSLTSIDTFSSLGGWEFTGSIPHSGRDFYVCIFSFVVVFLHFVHLKFCNSFCNVILFTMLNILKNWWPILRVSRYRLIIFNGCREVGTPQWTMPTIADHLVAFYQNAWHSLSPAHRGRYHTFILTYRENAWNEVRCSDICRKACYVKHACACNQWYTKDLVFGLAQMTLHVMMYRKFQHLPDIMSYQMVRQTIWWCVNNLACLI